MKIARPRTITFLIIVQLILALVVIWRVKILNERGERLVTPQYELKRCFDENNELKTGLELVPLN